MMPTPLPLSLPLLFSRRVVQISFNSQITSGEGLCRLPTRRGAHSKFHSPQSSCDIGSLE